MHNLDPRSPVQLLTPERLRVLPGGLWESDPSTGRLAVPGSQMLAQTLWAASRLAPSRFPHSVHARFLRPGRIESPVTYRLEVLRDGRTMSTVRATATQAGADLAVFDHSLCVADDEAATLDWQSPMQVPASDPLELKESVLGANTSLAAFDVRADGDAAAGGQTIHPYWIRHIERLPDDPIVHVALLAWLSDIGVSGSVFPPGTPLQRRVTGTSLDHAVWFHRPGRIDDWLWVCADSVTMVAGRGMAVGGVFDRSGRRLVTLAQEALFRSAAPVATSR